MPRSIHRELHRNDRIGWLRAVVLGANDGIVSTASLMIGVAAASSGPDQLLIAGIAGLVAGAMSMAAGEYVSVSSQADTEKSDLAREHAELQSQPDAELQELAGIYRERGLSPSLAEEVARQLMNHDALAAHARDELGITSTSSARPLQAALASAASFSIGAALPLLTALLTPTAYVVALMAITSLLFLVILGAIAARTGGAPVLKASVRVAFWGALAMAISAGVGRLFGVVI